MKRHLAFSFFCGQKLEILNTQRISWMLTQRRRGLRFILCVGFSSALTTVFRCFTSADISDQNN